MNTLTINNVSPKRSLYQHFLILPKHEAKHEREWKIKTETQHTPPLGGWIVSFVMEFYMKYKIVNLRVPVPQDPDELSTKELNLVMKDIAVVIASNLAPYVRMEFINFGFAYQLMREFFFNHQNDKKVPTVRSQVEDFLNDTQPEVVVDNDTTEIEVYKRGQRNTDS